MTFADVFAVFSVGLVWAVSAVAVVVDFLQRGVR